MRILVFLLIFFGCNASAQEGFRVIEKAERKISKGRYEKASRLLDRADTMNYGFCANAWWDARDAIMRNRVKIADAYSDTMLAIDLLCDTTIYQSYDQELIARILKLQDKESIRNEFRNALIHYEDNGWAPLYLAVQFSFREKPVYLKDPKLMRLVEFLIIQDDWLVRREMVDKFLASHYDPFILNGF